MDAFIAGLEPGRGAEVQALRRAVMAAAPGIREGIKWNAPSFATSDSFATMNLRQKTGLALILHFGTRKRVVPGQGYAIDDPEGLLKWLAPDRAMISFADAGTIDAQRDALAAVLRQWLALLDG